MNRSVVFEAKMIVCIVLLKSILGQTNQLYHITPGIFQERSIFLFSFHLFKHKPINNLQARMSCSYERFFFLCLNDVIMKSFCCHG